MTSERWHERQPGADRTLTTPSPDAGGPRDLVFTLFGEYLLVRTESVWVGSLISLLEPFGLAEGTVRTTLSRMVKKGWLEARRDGRHAFYSLTGRGRRLLEEGTERIFRPSRREAWDGRWFLLAYSIPQESRRLRDRLRDRLAWLGFGSFGNGVWISPHDVTAEVEELAAQLELGDRFVGFSARRVAGEDNAELVARCWDLEALAGRYRDFVARWSPVLDEVERTDPSPERCFTLRFTLIHEFRRFPLDDPYLPRTLLPDPWAGDAAADLFRSLHDHLAGPADAHVEAVLSEELVG
jgi:phenylacetic acid degradation operon negative regulatory protein